MNPLLEYFLIPASPLLAMAGGGTLLVAAECVRSQWKTAKLWLAISAAVASFLLSLWLWSSWPLAFGTTPLTSGAPWLVEFGRTYALDRTVLALYGAIALFTVLALGLMHSQFALSAVKTETMALVLFVASGMMTLVSADSLLMIFLGLELLSLPIYVLVGLRRRDKNSCEAALKYFLFGSFATVLLVFGIALLYARFGTMNLNVLGSRVAELVATPSADLKLALGGLVLVLVAVGFKVGLVPFHMWVPDVYEGAPTTVTAFMGSAVKLAGFGLAVRLLWGPFQPMAEAWSPILGWLAVSTMAVGNIAALAQDNLKRMFAYSSVAHAGFLAVGLCAVPTLGTNIGFLYYYLVVYGLMFLGLFGALFLIERATKSTDIFQLSGMGFTHPILGLALALFALSSAGIPPTAGFFAKYFVLAAAMGAGHGWLVVAAVLASLVGVYFYLRIVVYLYMKDSKESPRLGLRQEKLLVTFILLCAVELLLLSVFPDSLRLPN